MKLVLVGGGLGENDLPGQPATACTGLPVARVPMWQVCPDGRWHSSWGCSMGQQILGQLISTMIWESHSPISCQTKPLTTCSITKIFTKRLPGLQKMSYCNRFKTLKLQSLDRLVPIQFIYDYAVCVCLTYLTRLSRYVWLFWISLAKATYSLSSALGRLNKFTFCLLWTQRYTFCLTQPSHLFLVKVWKT